MEEIVHFPVVHFHHAEHELSARSQRDWGVRVYDRLHGLDDVLLGDGVFVQLSVHVRGEPDCPQRASFGEDFRGVEHDFSSSSSRIQFKRFRERGVQIQTPLEMELNHTRMFSLQRCVVYIRLFI